MQNIILCTVYGKRSFLSKKSDTFRSYRVNISPTMLASSALIQIDSFLCMRTWREVRNFASLRLQFNLGLLNGKSRTFVTPPDCDFKHEPATSAVCIHRKISKKFLRLRLTLIFCINSSVIHSSLSGYFVESFMQHVGLLVVVQGQNRF